MENKYSDLEKKINIKFKDRDLLENVFIHRSYLNEHKKSDLQSNERLELSLKVVLYCKTPLSTVHILTSTKIPSCRQTSG